MNIFQLIKQVLDDAYEDIPETDGPRDTVVKYELSRLQAKYKDLRKYAAIDYGDPATRFAYVFRYVTSHANLVATLVRGSTALTDILENENVQMAAIGGGPGSDMLGVLKHLDSRDHKGKLSVDIFDGEPTWGETWGGVFDRVESDVQIVPAFCSVDVTKRQIWGKFARYLKADLFTMIYFVSEVYGIRDEARPFFDHLLSRAKPGALLLYVDNNVSDFTNWFDGLLQAHGWEVTESGEETIKTPYAEEKRDLGVYFEKFGNPKIQADVAWRVARKK